MYIIHSLEYYCSYALLFDKYGFPHVCIYPNMVGSVNHGKIKHLSNIYLRECTEAGFAMRKITYMGIHIYIHIYIHICIHLSHPEAYVEIPLGISCLDGAFSNEYSPPSYIHMCTYGRKIQHLSDICLRECTGADMAM